MTDRGAVRRIVDPSERARLRERIPWAADTCTLKGLIARPGPRVYAGAASVVVEEHPEAYPVRWLYGDPTELRAWLSVSGGDATYIAPLSSREMIRETIHPQAEEIEHLFIGEERVAARAGGQGAARPEGGVAVRRLGPVDAPLLATLDDEGRDFFDRWPTVADALAALPVFGVVRDGRVIAFAKNNLAETDWVEVSVYTAPAWRGQGLAAVVAAALLRHNRAQGTTSVWGALSTNAASRRLAERLGLREVAQNYLCGVGVTAFD